MSKKSGFIDNPLYKALCQDSEHYAPLDIEVPADKIYQHVCPSCGREQKVYPKIDLGRVDIKEYFLANPDCVGELAPVKAPPDTVELHLETLQAVGLVGEITNIK